MTTQFILAYEVNGHTYTCKVDAPTFEDAERHLLALASTGRVSGEHVADVPVQLPVAAQHRFRHPQENMPGWSVWQPCKVAKRPAWEIDSQGYEVEYRELYTTPPDDEALLRQVLNDACGVKLCEVNSMSSRQEMLRLLDKMIAALRERLGETK